MDRLAEARRQIHEIHRACREGRPPESVAPETWSMLVEAVGADTMRAWRLAEQTVVELYLYNDSETEAAIRAVAAWAKARAHAASIGAPYVHLADTGMYPPRETATFFGQGE